MQCFEKCVLGNEFPIIYCTSLNFCAIFICAPDETQINTYASLTSHSVVRVISFLVIQLAGKSFKL